MLNNLSMYSRRRLAVHAAQALLVITNTFACTANTERGDHGALQSGINIRRRPLTYTRTDPSPYSSRSCCTRNYTPPTAIIMFYSKALTLGEPI